MRQRWKRHWIGHRTSPYVDDIWPLLKPSVKISFFGSFRLFLIYTFLSLSFSPPLFLDLVDFRYDGLFSNTWSDTRELVQLERLHSIDNDQSIISYTRILYIRWSEVCREKERRNWVFARLRFKVIFFSSYFSLSEFDSLISKWNSSRSRLTIRLRSDACGGYIVFPNTRMLILRRWKILVNRYKL